MEEEWKDSQRQKMTKNTKTKIPKTKTKKSERKALPKTLKPELSRIRLTLQNTKNLFAQFSLFSMHPLLCKLSFFSFKLFVNVFLNLPLLSTI